MTESIQQSHNQRRNECGRKQDNAPAEQSGPAVHKVGGLVILVVVEDFLLEGIVAEHMPGLDELLVEMQQEEPPR